MSFNLILNNDIETLSFTKYATNSSVYVCVYIHTHTHTHMKIQQLFILVLFQQHVSAKKAIISLNNSKITCTQFICENCNFNSLQLCIFMFSIYTMTGKTLRSK